MEILRNKYVATGLTILGLGSLGGLATACGTDNHESSSSDKVRVKKITYHNGQRELTVSSALREANHHQIITDSCGHDGTYRRHDPEAILYGNADEQPINTPRAREACEDGELTPDDPQIYGQIVN